MSDILKVYTGKQYAKMMRDKAIADETGLSDFNEGSSVQSEFEAIGAIVSTAQMDTKEAIRKAIPVAFYEGLKFKKKDATVSQGYFRFFRLPEFIFRYLGTESGTFSISATHFTTTIAGASENNLNLAFSEYATVADLVSAINSNDNYEASLVSNGLEECGNLYKYSAASIFEQTTYLNQSGVDVMNQSATAITIISGNQVTIDELVYQTQEEGLLQAGKASSGYIRTECLQTGKTGNMKARGIDTLNGKGYINSPVIGADYVVNDSAFSGGYNEESELERQHRFQKRVQGMGSGRATSIEADILEITGVRSCKVFESYPQRGTNTIFVDDGSGVISAELEIQIYKIIDGDPDDVENYPGKGVAGIVNVLAVPETVPVGISLVVYRLSGNSDIENITTTVQSAIETYVNTRKQGEDVIVSEVVRIAKNSHPAVYDVVISVPSTNVVIEENQVPRTGAGTGQTVSVSVITRTDY